MAIWVGLALLVITAVVVTVILLKKKADEDDKAAAEALRKKKIFEAMRKEIIEVLVLVQKLNKNGQLPLGCTDAVLLQMATCVADSLIKSIGIEALYELSKDKTFTKLNDFFLSMTDDQIKAFAACVKDSPCK